MTRTSWNVRDSTTEALEELLTRKYKEIEKSYKLLKKLSRLEDAQAMIDNIWSMKALANDIELELLRREYNNGATS